jgi:hypothetical protein
MRFAEVMAVIFALLLWRTTWLALRPGLVILLAGQIAVIFVLVYRNVRLARDAKRADDAGKAAVLAWFDKEEASGRWSAWLENGARIIGLALLAYGFWQMTGNLLITLAIGVVYPVSSYFGMMRKTSMSTAQYLRKRKDEITWRL